MTYKDVAENLADDIVDAFSDLQDNGYNKEDSLRVFEAIGQIAALAIDMKQRTEP